MRIPRRTGILLLPLLLAGCGSILDYPTPVAEVCNNGVDDDLDGKIDCADPDCDGQSECQEDCTNGVDDDLDGKIDCADPDCDGQCDEQGELCFDGRDNDGDGLVDADDAGCWSTRDDVTLERCATVPGTDAQIGATAGVDWYVIDPETKLIQWTLADGTSALSTNAVNQEDQVESSVVATGQLASTIVHVRLYDSCSGGSWQFLKLAADNAATPVIVEVSDKSVYLDADLGNEYPQPFVGCPTTFDLALVFGDDGTTVAVSIDGRPVSVVPLVGWNASTSFRLRWADLSYPPTASGIVSASVSRPDFQRCGEWTPSSGLSAETNALAWLPDGDICAAMGDRTLVAHPAANGAHTEWASAGSSSDGAWITALAWDPAASRLRGVVQSACGDTQPHQCGTPRLVSAPDCYGPWRDDGAMFPDPKSLGEAVGYGISTRSPTGGRHEVVFDNVGLLHVASSSDGSPGSFSLTSTATATATALRMTRVGNDWLSCGIAGDGVSLQLGLFGAASALAQLPPSGERGAFDEFGYDQGYGTPCAFDPTDLHRGLAYASGVTPLGESNLHGYGPIRIHVTPRQ